MWKPWTFPLIVCSGFILVGICTLFGLRAANKTIMVAGIYTAPDVPSPPTGNQNSEAQPAPTNIQPQPTFPVSNQQVVHFPDTTTRTVSLPAVFHSSVPCNTPMSATDFAAYKTRVSEKSLDADKLKEAKDVLTENCLSTAQIETILNLFTWEETKLEWAKFAYRRCTDHERYNELFDSLNSISVDDLKDYMEEVKPTGYISPIITGTESPGLPCTNAISTEDFTKLKEEVEDEVSDGSKLETAKEQLGNNCLTVSQVEEVMNIFNFLTAKLEWAKFAYHKTSDTENYPDLYDSLGSLSSKHELEDYIKKQQNK